jgi:predicted nucleic acid-binding Zn ribbon protein
MPIYAYKCSACGFAKDVLQKLSKQLTAAGFQLKGSGWYVTDFRDGAGNKKGAEKGAGDAGAPADGAAAKPADTSGAPAAAAAAPAASPAPAPAPAAAKSD